MSQIKQRQPIKMMKYFVFNIKWGQKEGEEHQKLIYYYSIPTLVVGMDQKISDICLAEAIINFGQQFGDMSEALQCDSARFVFFEMEKNFWSSMVISESYTMHKSMNNNNTSHNDNNFNDNSSDRNSSNDKSSNNNNMITEYHENELCDKFFVLKMKMIYKYFCLINGRINDLYDKLKHEEFIDKCQDFLDNYLQTSFELLPINLIELYSSIQYLPLSNLTFMSVQSLMNCVQSQDPNNRIESLIFIHNDQLVSSSLSLIDTKILYNYLTNIIIPEAVKEELNDISNKTRWLQINMPIYLYGNDCDHSNEENGVKTKLIERRLCLFRSINGSTIGLILKEFDEIIIKECGTLLSSRLKSLTNKLHETVTMIAKNQPITDSSSNKSSNDNNASTNAASSSSTLSKDIKFVYLNYSNCAQRGMNQNCRKLIDTDFTRLIIDLENDMANNFMIKSSTSDFDDDNGAGVDNQNQYIELIGKNTNDVWLINRTSDYRSLYVMLNYKNVNVIEASEMIDIMQNKHFKNLFFGI